MAVINEEDMHPLTLSMYKATNRAGLPVHLVTAMLHIARSTLYSWYAGVEPTKKYHAKIKVLTAVADLAVTEELLPTHPNAVDARWKEAITAYKAQQEQG